MNTINIEAEKETETRAEGVYLARLSRSQGKRATQATFILPESDAREIAAAYTKAYVAMYDLRDALKVWPFALGGAEYARLAKKVAGDSLASWEEFWGLRVFVCEMLDLFDGSNFLPEAVLPTWSAEQLLTEEHERLPEKYRDTLSLKCFPLSEVPDASEWKERLVALCELYAAARRTGHEMMYVIRAKGRRHGDLFKALGNKNSMKFVRMMNDLGSLQWTIENFLYAADSWEYPEPIKRLSEATRGTLVHWSL